MPFFCNFSLRQCNNSFVSCFIVSFQKFWVLLEESELRLGAGFLLGFTLQSLRSTVTS